MQTGVRQIDLGEFAAHVEADLTTVRGRTSDTLVSLHDLATGPVVGPPLSEEDLAGFDAPGILVKNATHLFVIDDLGAESLVALLETLQDDVIGETRREWPVYNSKVLRPRYLSELGFCWTTADGEHVPLGGLESTPAES